MDHNSQRDQAAPSNVNREKFDLYLLAAEAERNQFDAEFLQRISKSRCPASVDVLVQHCIQRFELIAKQFAFLAFAGGPLDVDQHYGGPLEKSREKTLEFFDRASRNIPADSRREVRSGLALELASELQHQLASAKAARLSNGGERAASEGGVAEMNQIDATEPRENQSTRTEAWLADFKSGRTESFSGDAAGGTSAQTTLAATDGNGADRTDASWQDIEIWFLGDHRVEIRAGAKNETRNYAELGFADRRAKRGQQPKPNQAWMILRKMAENNGIVRAGATTVGVFQKTEKRVLTRELASNSRAGSRAVWSKVEKRIGEIRRALKGHFGITTDPVPFVRGTGYQAAFKIGCRPSFRT